MVAALMAIFVAGSAVLVLFAYTSCWPSDGRKANGYQPCRAALNFDRVFLAKYGDPQAGTIQRKAAPFDMKKLRSRRSAVPPGGVVSWTAPPKSADCAVSITASSRRAGLWNINFGAQMQAIRHAAMMRQVDTAHFGFDRCVGPVSEGGDDPRDRVWSDPAGRSCDSFQGHRHAHILADADR